MQSRGDAVQKHRLLALPRHPSIRQNRLPNPTWHPQRTRRQRVDPKSLRPPNHPIANRPLPHGKQEH